MTKVQDIQPHNHVILTQISMWTGLYKFAVAKMMNHKKDIMIW